jgi:sulfhydrogenase subunit beta (sulfur reductase)
MSTTQPAEHRILPKVRFDDLLHLLVGDGFEVIGPRIEQEAIVYGPIRSSAELPIGWTDRQAPGSYGLEKGTAGTYFGYAVGPHSWKKYLFPPLLRLWQARRTTEGFDTVDGEPEPPPRAFLGVRACELQAIVVQDKVFLQRAEQWTDPHYAQARARLFLVAVECEHPAGTCFCASMGTGPAVKPGLPFDLALTELDDVFLARAGTAAGQAVLDRLGLASAGAADVNEAGRRVEQAARSMGRSLDVIDVHDLLHRNQEHPRWDQVADRCLACTNCTLVCPTCFCTSVEDVTELDLESAARVRRWDSCFNPEFAQVHGGNFRPSIRGRYRQWLTHKFASWHDQFDVSGCVGCGRCITWCPVGIDVTEEITAIRAADGQRKEQAP